MGYVANTYLLELAAPSTLVLNDPRGVRDLSEKIATLRFPDLIAPTFVGRHRGAIRAFAERHGAVVLKPAFFMGGEGIRKADASDTGFEALVEAMLGETAPEPIIVQAFIPGVKDGDKRVFLVAGEPVGAVRRLPRAGDFRANLHVGGQAAPGVVDDRDRAIAAAVAPLLAERGILFAGLDVIDGRLTEINVTSPTLARNLLEFGGADVARLVLDKIEVLAAQRRR
jgi:glutathione synthase